MVLEIYQGSNDDWLQTVIGAAKYSATGLL